MMDHIQKAMNCLMDELLQKQSSNGSWIFCFEGGTLTDSLMILLMEWLKWENRPLRNLLLERILCKQTVEGPWKLYEDEDGNVSETLFSCLALLYSGAKKPSDPEMKKAREFVLSQGGMTQSGSLSKVILSLFGHLSWTKQPTIPIEFLLLPPRSPVHFFDFVGYTRVHLAPILILANRQFSVDLPRKELVSEWLGSCGTDLIHNKSRFWRRALKWTASLHFPFARESLSERAFCYARQFMLDRIEPDGTLYSYLTSTFLMVFALASLGLSDHSVIKQAMKGLECLAYPVSEGIHLQETTSTIWDTSLILHALQEAGVSSRHPAICRGLHYLLKHQHKNLGDWVLQNPGVLPGGWGFSHSNTINPDVDDTSACLRAIAPTVRKGKHSVEWLKGVNWLVSMQNRDGGWPAFEKNTNKIWLYLLPYSDAKTVVGDPSTADMTGRTLEFFGSQLGWTIHDPVVIRGIYWLLRNQQTDGSWFGRWGISYIYGTWAALTGMAAVQFPNYHPAVQKAIKWLYSIQNPDGGWGESCRSQVECHYIPLQASTLSQTAWALDALIACHDQPTPQMRKGMMCLLRLLEKESWVHAYPTGAGLAGQFYIHYHSYNYIWPLLTLAHYWKKYKE
ncbi:squalene--hopene cyclase [Thermoflavimicrobium dichotomicum]|uniref:Sporulenol synthase n=1 Tax=Thermoflavimicrobium dichotomicum TaxID=46223 RepID=A0A1I3LGK3_9BACL|nr:squalene--hopene cyclase [Thermoflavimicrobium dichotomicum]SFI83918.1 sporulenol synthase [Thermoflavimicrobium dichotomicum]